MRDSNTTYAYFFFLKEHSLRRDYNPSLTKKIIFLKVKKITFLEPKKIYYILRKEYTTKITTLPILFY